MEEDEPMRVGGRMARMMNAVANPVKMTGGVKVSVDGESVTFAHDDAFPKVFEILNMLDDGYAEYHPMLVLYLNLHGMIDLSDAYPGHIVSI